MQMDDWTKCTIHSLDMINFSSVFAFVLERSGGAAHGTAMINRRTSFKTCQIKSSYSLASS